MPYGSFLLYAFLTSFTPGPNNIAAMSTAGSYGFARAFRYCAGVFFGFFVLLVLAAAFSAALSTFVPKMELPMKIIGALYMLYLGFVIVRDKPHGEKKESKFKPDSVYTGFLLQFVNPKGILYAITSMASFVLPYTQSALLIGLFALLLAAIALASTTAWALCGAVFERLFTKHKKALNIVMALLLLYCAVSLFFS